MPVDGDPVNTRWIFYGANGRYLVGKFDGKDFTPESGPHHLQHGNCWYASQTYSDIPAKDGRRILIPWGRLPDGEIFRDMKFNQMMGLPVELTLRSAGSEGVRLEVNPVRELTALRQRTHTIQPQPLAADTNPLAGIKADLVEIEAVLKVESAGEITFDLRGVPLVYEVGSRKLSCLKQQTTVVPKDGKVALRIFVDRVAVDIFGDAGRLYLPMAAKMAPEHQALKLTCQGGAVAVESLKVHELKSAW
jgi:sucrose-6-phosphate hydrolase SacC (GH32 family)